MLWIDHVYTQVKETECHQGAPSLQYNRPRYTPGFVAEFLDHQFQSIGCTTLWMLIVTPS